MGKFLLGVLVALLVGAGIYYLFLMEEDEQALEREVENGAALEVEVAPRIPAGAIMEDGTVSE